MHLTKDIFLERNEGLKVDTDNEPVLVNIPSQGDIPLTTNLNPSNMGVGWD